MGLEQVASKTAARIDYDTYRLRTFVEGLGEMELERRSGTTKLSAVAGALEANPKAVLFNAAGAGGDSCCMVAPRPASIWWRRATCATSIRPRSRAASDCH